MAIPCKVIALVKVCCNRTRHVLNFEFLAIAVNPALHESGTSWTICLCTNMILEKYHLDTCDESHVVNSMKSDGAASKRLILEAHFHL